MHSANMSYMYHYLLLLPEVSNIKGSVSFFLIRSRIPETTLPQRQVYGTLIDGPENSWEKLNSLTKNILHD